MNRATPMPAQRHASNYRHRKSAGRSPKIDAIECQGTLVVKWIDGRNGAFPVGDLQTAAGTFKVKDALLEQFEEGAYEGRFRISEIFAKAYEYRGRIIIDTRATLAGLQIYDESFGATDSDGPELDPIDEAAPAAPPADRAPPPPQNRPDSLSGEPPGDETDLSALFGSELYEKIHEGGSLKLDPTVDRVLFRQQRQTLKDKLGYRFEVKNQTWYPPQARS